MKSLLKLIAFLLFFCCIESIHSQDNPVIRFGIIADIQYCDYETRGERYYRNSLAKLEDCINDFNQEKVQFVINLGDLIDRDVNKNLDSVLLRLKKVDSPVYNTTGNHDYENNIENDDLYKRLNMPNEYYAFTEKNWRFIMLNTNEISSYANKNITWKENELILMLDKIKGAGKKNGQPWNGGISNKQLNWLAEQLKDAEKKNEQVLIFAHHPIFPPFGLTALNDDEILNIISEYPCVKGMISGHHHTGEYGEFKGIPFITTEGMIETENSSAYGIIDIYENKFVLTGKGRTKSYQIIYANQ